MRQEWKKMKKNEPKFEKMNQNFLSVLQIELNYLDFDNGTTNIDLLL